MNKATRVVFDDLVSTPEKRAAVQKISPSILKSVVKLSCESGKDALRSEPLLSGEELKTVDFEAIVKALNQ